VARTDQTDLGGPNEAFRTTHWTQIHDARTAEAVRRRGATGRVLAQYWKPVYCYLRRKGCRNEEAKDLTQGFFEVALRRGLIQQADRAKGRFRAFLLTALDRYVRNVHRDETAKKRAPVTGLVSLHGLASAEVPVAAREATPEAAFHYAWACQLLNEALATVEAQCLQRGQLAHWEAFRARILQPILEGADPPPLSELCERFGIESAIRASNMIVTMRRRLRVVLKDCVRRAAGAEADVDEEIGDLLDVFSEGRAGWRPKPGSC
jgi:RNA polymerase sigma-70 factor (ECF subfamily)